MRIVDHFIFATTNGPGISVKVVIRVARFELNMTCTWQISYDASFLVMSRCIVTGGMIPIERA